MSSIPSPRDRLADCVWLPRIIAKARQILAGTLPPAYAERFCHPTGMDNRFLEFFHLTQEDILSASNLEDGAIAGWFLGLTTPERIAEWNHLAVNMGRPGFPMAERLPIALATVYTRLAPSKISTIFEALEADDALE